ncbi:MAG: fluoride efflux transporter CrcB [Puniceicoccaceae bacterium]|nr:MAG: fluoride efflux transporter CrcB [Puniceicoccaceae bacterium]
MTDETWLAVLLLAGPGSALGGMARYVVSGWAARRFGERFPAGTLLVNTTGAFLIGLAVFFPWEAFWPEAGGWWRLGLTYGFLGGYTTVSSFSLQTLHLFREGEHRAALLNLAGSYLLCLAAVFAGAVVVRALFPMPLS